MRKSSNTYILLITAGLLVVAISGMFLFSMILRWERTRVTKHEPWKEQELMHNVPYPIVLIHGLGGKAEGWVDIGLVDFLRQKGLRYGGMLRVSPHTGQVNIEEDRYRPAQGDFFSIHISDPFQSLVGWSRELQAGIKEILQVTGAPRVVLVGFSAGGVAARKYLTENLHDHFVAKLLTIASPHRGSELALASRLKEELQKRSQKSQPLQEGYQGALAAFERLEEQFEMKVDSALVEELVPEEYNEFLQNLNSSDHPEDVEYACILATGSAPIGNWQELKAELATLRGRDPGSSKLIEKLSTAVMKTLAAFSENNSSAGDGAVLLGSQDLSRLPFFQKRPDLIKDVQLIDSGHLDAKGRYHKIFEILEGEIKFLEARQVQDANGNMNILVDFIGYLGGLSAVEAKDASGQVLRVLKPRIYRRGDRGFARATIGPMPEMLTVGADLIVKPVAGEQIYGTRIVYDGAGLVGKPALMRGTTSFIFTIHKVWGLSSKRWDLVDANPDLQAVLFVDGNRIFQTEIFENADGFVEFNQETQLLLDPTEARLVLELWDIDAFGVPEVMGNVVWNPGQLPMGRETVLTDTGISVRVEVLPRHDGGVIWDPDPLTMSRCR